MNEEAGPRRNCRVGSFAPVPRGDPSADRQDMNILSFGSCNIDLVYRLPHITSPGETNRAASLDTFPGGKGLNQSVAVARAGLPVCHAGKIGEDGAFLLDFMKESGIDTTLVRPSHLPTGHAVIQVDDEGNNAIFILNGANFDIGKAEIDEVLSRFSEGDILTVQNEISEVPYLISRAAARGMKVFYNPSPIGEGNAATDLSDVFCLIVNETEARYFSDFSVEEEFFGAMRERYPHLHVLLTLGSRGCLYFSEGNVTRAPAFLVEATDTTAAGDTFTGYFIASFARGLDLTMSLKIASAAAALAVSKRGAASSIPTLAEVENALSYLSPRPTEEDFPTRLFRYLDASLQSATIEGAAAALGYSKFSVGKTVKEKTGKNFSSLLRARRCEKAASLLLSTDLPIGEIIAEVGYQNESFFRRAFYDTYQKTPSEYRKCAKTNVLRK